MMTDDDINELWCTHGPHEVLGAQPGTKVHDFARAIIAAERERCAKVVRGLIIPGPSSDPLIAGGNLFLGLALDRINHD